MIDRSTTAVDPTAQPEHRRLDLRLGIDVGATNTDAVVLDRDDRLLAKAKSPTTPDVTSGIENAVDAVLAAGHVDQARITHAMLGTTHATNAVLERRRLHRVAILRIDVTVQAEVADLFRRLRATEGTAFLLVSHDLALVAGLADRISIIDHGRIVERRGPEVLQAPADPVTRRSWRPILRCLGWTADERGAGRGCRVGGGPGRGRGPRYWGGHRADPGGDRPHRALPGHRPVRPSGAPAGGPGAHTGTVCGARGRERLG